MMQIGEPDPIGGKYWTVVGSEHDVLQVVVAVQSVAGYQYRFHAHLKEPLDDLILVMWLRQGRSYEEFHAGLCAAFRTYHGHVVLTNVAEEPVLFPVGETEDESEGVLRRIAVPMGIAAGLAPH